MVWLHQFLFDDMDYEVTENIKDYDVIIKSETNQYLKK